MSKISWTTNTWNPITGCTPTSEGCSQCYAERMHKRLRGMGQAKYQHDFNEVRCHPESLDKIPSGKMIFVCSMSDLFHKDVPEGFIIDIYARMLSRPDQIFQVLTKRPERMANAVSIFRNYYKAEEESMDHIWHGVTAENQEQFEARLEKESQNG